MYRIKLTVMIDLLIDYHFTASYVIAVTINGNSDGSITFLRGKLQT